MKIERDKPKFEPVAIVLESEKEVDFLHKALSLHELTEDAIVGRFRDNNGLETFIDNMHIELGKLIDE